MRLIDAHELREWFPVSAKKRLTCEAVVNAVDAAPTISCAECVDGPERKSESPLCRTCFGSNFKRREP